MSSSEKAPKRTAVYIDGYNLYYGRLRGTPFKWLDVVQLFQALLTQRDQNESLERVNFFTAYALASFATNGKAAVEAQSAYHRALKARYGARFDIIYGNHSYDSSGALLPAFVPGQPYDRKKRVRVWKLEEKKTDVNLAITMYRDACQGRYDRIVLVSNDSDAEPALEAIRQDFPHIMIGVVTPVHPPVAGSTTHRRVSGSLLKLSDWSVSNLTDEQLQQAQLPSVVPTNKKAIHKPKHW
ncbi:NYN domain-containing protein [Chitinimonas sp. BJB300]|uniref:NYN domain-containing protein n=1 Tax=Chitinimonas sp. BJB300 TaxID=1559339 RepID=UPI000C10BE89|nr:NYN domain-containing protein [Chitinimonas sp. BJB300]PHV09784.1 acetyltransferase [Chitinimonas sp. BJB300]TSJ84639.1 NYN domain-containing protein [Chitinimonas sp. BJB300]